MEPAHLFIGSQSDITCLFMNNSDLYSGDIDGNLIKWNFDSRRPELKCKAHDKSIINIEYLQTVNQIITRGRDGYLKFWIITENRFLELNRMESNQFSFCGISVYHSINLEFICNPLNDQENTIEIIEFPRNIITHHLEARPQTASGLSSYGMAMGICVLDASVLIVGYESGYIVVFRRFQPASSVKVADQIMCIAANIHNSIIVGTPEHELIVLTVASDATTVHLRESKRIRLTNPGVAAIACRRDGRIFASAGWDGLVRVFSARSHKQLAVLKWDIAPRIREQNSGQLCVAFTDDDYLVSGCDDKIICFWDVFRDK